MYKRDMTSRRLTVLGAGVSGAAIARMAARLGAQVFVSDAAEITAETADSFELEGIRYEQEGHTEKIFDCDTVVVGSGFPPNAPILGKLASRGMDPVGELDFVMPFLKGHVIGITGSNGKTTTASLLGHLLKAEGVNCAVAGNIGNPAADAAGTDYDYIVLELSSFQLHWAMSVKFAGAIVTNLAPDHIDWHGSYENYVRAKAKLVGFVEDGFAIVQKRDGETLKRDGISTRYLTWNPPCAENDIFLSREEASAVMNGKELFRFGETGLLGFHNMENIAMAMGMVEMLGMGAAARASLPSYTAPAHRCGLVLEKSGVRYIDDSKGTNIAASVTAMSAIEGPHIVILGGRGKGENYGDLAEPLKKYAKYAYLVGEAAEEIGTSLAAGGFVDYAMAGDMENAVKRAVSAARPGDSVLLSPACTSWDVYNNYKERGDHFASLVRKYTGV
ncbi:MAG: UDP-N-acetylmuramoyl-L-alanine--D-glutamate ligase [Synergistaceae bacterium]|jgi:UDP-N-acetylmuramoylalanine--D-glutamate ligase|nr:UDP-N-acetylmuramoyl-L-alanine--D-glutamate ligase [Synergistaceae bacterium]